MAAAATATTYPSIAVEGVAVKRATTTATTVRTATVRTATVRTASGVWQIGAGELTVAIFLPDIAVFVRAHRKLVVLCSIRRTAPVGVAASHRVGKSATDTGGCLRLLDQLAYFVRRVHEVLILRAHDSSAIRALRR